MEYQACFTPAVPHVAIHLVGPMVIGLQMSTILVGCVLFYLLPYLTSEGFARSHKIERAATWAVFASTVIIAQIHIFQVIELGVRPRRDAEGLSTRGSLDTAMPALTGLCTLISGVYLAKESARGLYCKVVRRRFRIGLGLLLLASFAPAVALTVGKALRRFQQLPAWWNWLDAVTARLWILAATNCVTSFGLTKALTEELYDLPKRGHHSIYAIADLVLRSGVFPALLSIVGAMFTVAGRTPNAMNVAAATSFPLPALCALSFIAVMSRRNRIDVMGPSWPLGGVKVEIDGRVMSQAMTPRVGQGQMFSPSGIGAGPETGTISNWLEVSRAQGRQMQHLPVVVEPAPQGPRNETE